MQTLAKLLVFSFLIFSMTSCFLEGISGDRNVVSQTRGVSSDFDAISASQGLDVYLTMGSKPSIEVEADENLHDVIITEVEDGVLRIYTEKNIRSAKSRKIYVTTESLDEIRVTSAARITCENTIVADDFEINATSAADVRLVLDVDKLTCDATSAAQVKLEGKADNFIARSTSAAEIKARDLESKICDAEATSAANIQVNVSEELDASATSAGNIRYTGDPKKVKKNSTSGGSISG